MDKLEHIGMVARWRPVHRGHAVVLRALCQRAERVLIGIGSSNRYDARNPFTVEETQEMIRLVLEDHDNFTLFAVPDLGDGPRWRRQVVEIFGPLDLFLTANPYVAHLMADLYPVQHPVTLVPTAQRVALDGAMVRQAMARGSDWRNMVPPIVGDYLGSRRLDERFRREFGLQTLAEELDWRQDVLMG